MTTMNLRIGFKPSHYKKVMNPVCLSPEFLNLIDFGDEDTDLRKYLEKFCLTSSVEQQLLELKLLIKVYMEDKDLPVQKCEPFVKFLVEVYLRSEPKNPLKNSVARCFSSCRPALQPLVVSGLASRLTNLFKDARDEVGGRSALTSLNGTVSALAVSLDLPLGIAAVGACLNEAMAFINDCLQKYIQLMSVERVPSQKQELHLYIHNATRVLIVMVQKAMQSPGAREALDSVSAAPAGGGDSPVRGDEAVSENEVSQAQDLPDKEQLYSVLCQLVSSQELPLDSRTNCSLALVALTSHTEGLSGWQSLLQVAVGMEVKDLWSEMRSDPLTRLCVCSGLLAAVPTKELATTLPTPAFASTFGDSDSAGPIALHLLFDVLMELASCQPSEPTLELGTARTLQRLVRSVALALDKTGKNPAPEIGSLSLLDHDSAGGDAGIATSDVMEVPPPTEVKLPVEQVLMQLVESLMDRLLPLLWSLLESGADAIRHAGRGTLLHLAQVALAAKALGKGNILTVLTEATLSLPRFRKAYFLALGALATKLPPQNFSAITPEDLLAVLHDSTLRSAASGAYEALMNAELSTGEAGAETWERRWVMPLASALSSSSSSLPPGAATEVEDLLGKAVRSRPAVAAHLANVLLCHGEDTSSSEDRANGGSRQTETGPLRALLACLRAAHRQGAFDKIECMAPSKWNGAIDYSMLLAAAVHSSDEVRLSALALLVETHRSTQALSRVELDLARSILKYTANSQAPATRQQATGVVKKLLVRLRDSGAALKRQGSDHAAVNDYSTFLEWLVEFSFANLFAGANFGRRSFSLKLLCLVVEVLGTEPGSAIPESFWSPANGSTLLRCLNDSYEENKQSALWLIRKFPAEALNFHDSSFVLSLLHACHVLMKSTRPPDSASAAYFLRAIASFPGSQAVRIAVVRLEQRMNCFFSPVRKLADDLDKSHLQIRLLRTLTRVLAETVGQAQTCLMMAASRNPIYGSLLCIRMLLEDVDLESLSSNGEWREVLSWLTMTTYNACTAVEAVVNSSSPEGHLPMDSQLACYLPGAESVGDTAGGSTEEETRTEWFPAETVEEGEMQLVLDLQESASLYPFAASEFLPPQGQVTEPRRVSAQGVLLCAWRTVKETSLLLGLLAERAPIIEGGADTSQLQRPGSPPLRGLISEKQLLHMGDHFTRLLANIKHRGAFEQAYVGFCKLCSRLWNMRDSVGGSGLHLLPVRWLNELLQMVANGDEAATTSMGGVQVRLCATRRSAGVPFLVQALLTTEPQGCGGMQPMFNRCVDTLLEMAEAPPRIKSVSDARIHALNILRALFRSSQLAERAVPYVARTVEVAVRGFRSSSWSERNASTLLFAALMTRLFGVSRARDQERERRMTGRLFFHQYPQLYDFLLNELTLPTPSSPMVEQLGAGVFPSLVLLSRLYPSSLEGTDSHLQLSRFVPLVQQCAGAAVEKTRVLAAKALVPLVAAEEWVSTAGSLLAAAATPEPLIPWNTRHGLLLQVTCLVEAFAKMAISSKMMKPPVTQWLEMSAWLLMLPRRQVRCFMVAEAYVRFLHAVTKLPYLGRVPAAQWHAVRQVLEEELFVSPGTALPIYSLCHIPGVSLYNMRATLLLLHLTRLLSNDRRVCMGEDPVKGAVTAADLVAKLVALGAEGCCDSPLAAASWAARVFPPASPDQKSPLPFEPWNSDDKKWKGLKVEDPELAKALAQNKALAEAVTSILLQDHSSASHHADLHLCCFQLLPHLPLVLELLAKALTEGGNEAEGFENVVAFLLDAMKADPDGVGPAALAAAANAAFLAGPTGCDDLCNALEWANSPDVPSSLHMAAANILLARSAELLLLGADEDAMEKLPLQALSFCKAWSTVMMLLDDDDAEVRSRMAELTKALPTPPQGSVTPGYARELLVEAFATCLLRDLYPVYTAGTLAYWNLLRGNASDDVTFNSESDDTGASVFERGDSNAFAEPAMLAELASEHLATLVMSNGHLIQTPLPPDLHEWLSERCLDTLPVVMYCTGLKMKRDVNPRRSASDSPPPHLNTLTRLAENVGERLVLGYVETESPSDQAVRMLMCEPSDHLSIGYRYCKLQDALRPVVEQDDNETVVAAEIGNPGVIADDVGGGGDAGGGGDFGEGGNAGGAGDAVYGHGVPF